LTKSEHALGGGRRFRAPSDVHTPVPETGPVPPRPERGGTACLSPITARPSRSVVNAMDPQSPGSGPAQAKEAA